jgi:hypothetical protein
MAGGAIMLGYALFLLMAITAVVALTLRSRIAAVASLVLMVLVGLMAIAFCSTTVDPHEPDRDVFHWAEADRHAGTVWAWGLLVVFPVATIAGVLAFRSELSRLQLPGRARP